MGTVLIKLLFLAFINDIGIDIDVNIHLFANDYVLYTELKVVKNRMKLNRCLYTVSTRCKGYQMLLNTHEGAKIIITHKINLLLLAK